MRESITHTRTSARAHTHTHWTVKWKILNKRYEWMSHKQLTWSHLSSFLWLDGNKCDKKKKDISVLLHYGLKQGASVLPAQSRVVGWICIQLVGPWENVSLECIVSRIGPHLENHLPKSPQLLLSVPSTCSSRPPSYRSAQAHANIFIHRPHLSWVQDDVTRRLAVLVKSAKFVPKQKTVIFTWISINQ